MSGSQVCMVWLHGQVLHRYQIYKPANRPILPHHALTCVYHFVTNNMPVSSMCMSQLSGQIIPKMTRYIQQFEQLSSVGPSKRTRLLSMKETGTGLFRKHSMWSGNMTSAACYLNYAQNSNCQSPTPSSNRKTIRKQPRSKHWHMIGYYLCAPA